MIPMGFNDSLAYAKYLSMSRNHVVNFEGFYCSYLSSSPDYDGPNTALVKNDMSVFYTLLGDHRKNYFDIVEAGGTWNECVEYFMDNLDKMDSHSERVCCNLKTRELEGSFQDNWRKRYILNA